VNYGGQRYKKTGEWKRVSHYFYLNPVDALEHTFKFLGHFAIKNAGVGQNIIDFFSLLVGDDINEFQPEEQRKR
jgi:hypothetical protein